MKRLLAIVFAGAMLAGCGSGPTTEVAPQGSACTDAIFKADELINAQEEMMGYMVAGLQQAKDNNVYGVNDTMDALDREREWFELNYKDYLVAKSECFDSL
jgi:PBP1b-binding outer membrane lipoprotein LpoB